MNIDKEKLRRRFSRSAAEYDKYAGIQKHMGRRLMDLIPETAAAPEQILEIGCGTGALTRLLAERYPSALITAADLAPGMLKEAQSRLADPRITWVCADAEEMHFPERYDLIISNATFQWFNDPQGTLAQLAAAVTPGGCLCFSTFGSDTFLELHASWQAAQAQINLVDPVPPGQTFLTAGELAGILAGISDRPLTEDSLRIEEETVREHFDSCLDFLTSVKKIGANRSMGDGQLPVPGLLDRAMDIYDTRFRDGLQVYATYHCLYAGITL